MQHKNKKIVVETQQYNDAKSIFITLAIVILSFSIIYFLTSIITGEIKFNNKKNKTKEPVATYIQYKEITSGQTFNINEDQYYVIFYSFKTDNNIMKQIIQGYETKDNNINIYTVNLDNGFNKNVLSDVSNPTVKNASDLKVKNNTLIKIDNKNNSLYIEGIDAIGNYLK